MEATMSSEATYRPLGFGAAFARQFRLLWSSRRPLLLLLAGLGLLALAGEPWSDGPLARFFTPWFFWVVPMGPLWAFTVWHNEGPSARFYMLSQPVSRWTHILARTAAGLAWLWAVYAAVALFGLIFALFDGNAWQFAQLPAIGWAGYFVGAAIGYLIISVLTIPSDYPVRWFFAILFLVPITVSLLVERGGLGEEIQWLFTPLIDPEWGLGYTVVGPLAGAVGTLGRSVMGVSASGQGPTMPDPGTWTAMAIIWILFWGLLVAAVAARHPDRFRRLYRKKVAA